jgi:hypothetical protein
MSNELIDMKVSFLHAVDTFSASVAKLGDEGVVWVPGGTKNSTAGIVGHTVHASKWILGEMVLGELEIGHPGEMSTEVVPADELCAELATMADSYRTCAQLSVPGYLEEKRKFRGQQRSVREILNFNLWHVSFHSGQVVLMRQMWDAQHS